MIEVTCDFCPKELTEKGALVFSPPAQQIKAILGVERDITTKFHMCIGCYKKIIIPKLGG